jgi:hypothetical protein
VFTSSLSGVAVDKDDYENAGSSVDPGINDVDVFLYLEEEDRNSDFDAWKDDGTMPDEAEEELYHLHEVTSTEPNSGTNGYFQFDSVVWNNLFPKYGDSEDVREVYLLFFHSAYGMVKKKVTLTADADKSMGAVQLERTSEREIRYGGQLRGVVWKDGLVNADGQYESGEEVDGAEVELYVDRKEQPDSGDTPDYAAYSLTDSDGNSGVFSFEEVVWKDTMNAERYSKITCYVRGEHDTAGSSGWVKISMYANTANFVTLELQ